MERTSWACLSKAVDNDNHDDGDEIAMHCLVKKSRGVLNTSHMVHVGSVNLQNPWWWWWWQWCQNRHAWHCLTGVFGGPEGVFVPTTPARTIKPTKSTTSNAPTIPIHHTHKIHKTHQTYPQWTVSWARRQCSVKTLQYYSVRSYHAPAQCMEKDIFLDLNFQFHPIFQVEECFVVASGGTG